MRRISLGLSVWPSVLSSVCYKSQNQIERTHSVTHRVLDWMVVHGIQHERGLPDVVVCLLECVWLPLCCYSVNLYIDFSWLSVVVIFFLSLVISE